MATPRIYFQMIIPIVFGHFNIFPGFNVEVKKRAKDPGLSIVLKIASAVCIPHPPAVLQPASAPRDIPSTC
jgi:hypothetical protein